MTTKKEYNVGDSTWIHGITKNNQLVEGKVIKKFTMDHEQWSNDWYYIVSIPTPIEPLLEVRTWENMSQDSMGPIGIFRDTIVDKNIIDRYIKKIGYDTIDNNEPSEPTDEEICSALEKSVNNFTHKPLVLKEKRYKSRKKYDSKRT